jgi:hypothetical protein
VAQQTLAMLRNISQSMAVKVVDIAGAVTMNNGEVRPTQRFRVTTAKPVGRGVVDGT